MEFISIEEGIVYFLARVREIWNKLYKNELFIDKIYKGRIYYEIS